MERPSRRSAMGNGGGGFGSSRRRRRDASAEPSASASASASDGADTDSSSLASGSRTRSSRRSAAREDHEDEREEPRHEREEDREEEKQEQSEPEEDASESGDRPARRERSLSNVSTTSSTSSGASEPRSAEARHARHALKMGELEQKRRMVEDGTLAEFCRRVTEFKEDRNRLLQTAEWHKNLQLKNGGELYAFELQRAEQLWLHGKEVLKADMVAKLDAVKARLLKELGGLEKAGTSPSRQGNLASEAPLVETNSSLEATGPADTSDAAVAETAGVEAQTTVVNGEPAQKKRKLELPEDLVRLSFDDISADLAAIAITRKGHSEAVNVALPSTQMEPMKIERRRLFCGKNIFQDGDEVVIASPVIKEDYVGRISSVTDEAVYVKLSSGQKVRIYLDLIKTKRCELKPLLRGLPALVEYESY